MAALEWVMKESEEKHTILQSLSLYSSHADQVWKLGSRDLSTDCLHFYHCFCVTEHYVAKAFITTTATDFLSSQLMEHMGEYQEKEGN